MNAFLNHALISLNTASMAKYISYQNRKAYFDNLKLVKKVIKQKIMRGGGGGLRLALTMLTQRGGSKI